LYKLIKYLQSSILSYILTQVDSKNILKMLCMATLSSS